jgi:hypothetical protein
VSVLYAALTGVLLLLCASVITLGLLSLLGELRLWWYRWTHRWGRL